jgi:hypothetical protein
MAGTAALFVRRIAAVLCAAALSGAGILFPSQAGADTTPPDTTPPVVTITSPTGGSTLTDLTDPVVVSASASDDVGVVAVQFWLDGGRLGLLIRRPPYEMRWDIRTAGNGNHTLSAVARDAAGNSATSTVRVTVWAVPEEGSAFAGKPLPTVRDRLGLIPRDYVWAASAPSSTGVRTGYVTYDRDPLSMHDLSWFLEYHPDWLVYKCDRVTPIRYFTDPFYVFDISSPEVRAYQYGVFVRNYMKSGFDGIAIDNFVLRNYAGKCGVYDKQGVWRQKYTGQLDDPQYIEDAIAWLTWMSDRVRADGGLVAINSIEPLHPDLDRVTSRVDLVYFEAGGFINTYCAPAWTDESWLGKFRALRKIAVERGLVVQDETCDFMSQLTPELVSWDVANFFLLRGDRSYFSMTQSYARRPLVEPDYDGPELHAPLGEPLGEPQQQGILWTRPYENGLVVVNPSSRSSGVISLEGSRLADLHGRVFTGDVTVPAASGLVLLRATPDLAVYRSSTGQWRVLRSAGAATVLAWGDPAQLDVPVHADFDGDGQGDIAVYRATTGQWFVLHSGGGVTALTWGDPAQLDVPLAADFDGDGRADIAVYRGATGQWFVLHSAGGATILTWGDPARLDVPTPADFDGDGRADVAIYRGATGQWFVLHSAGGATILTWGDPAQFDAPTPADFDGDGRADIAVYRGATGQWFVLHSGGGVTILTWGDPGLSDVPVPADYDRDGRADIAVYRGATGRWFALLSAGGVRLVSWGDPAQGDLPLPLSAR